MLHYHTRTHPTENIFISNHITQNIYTVSLEFFAWLFIYCCVYNGFDMHEQFHTISHKTHKFIHLRREIAEHQNIQCKWWKLFSLERFLFSLLLFLAFVVYQIFYAFSFIDHTFMYSFFRFSIESLEIWYETNCPTIYLLKSPINFHLNWCVVLRRKNRGNEIKIRVFVIDMFVFFFPLFCNFLFADRVEKLRAKHKSCILRKARRKLKKRKHGFEGSDFRFGAHRKVFACVYKTPLEKALIYISTPNLFVFSHFLWNQFSTRRPFIRHKNG